jgi:hypothetical protein
MTPYITIQVGKESHSIDAALLPPIGTRFIADNRLSGDSAVHQYEVASHTWQLMVPHDGQEVLMPYFVVGVKTRLVD